MSAFIVSFEKKHWSTEFGMAPLADALTSQGFQDPEFQTVSNACVVWCDSMIQKRANERRLVREDGFIFVVGVLVYKDKMTTEALGQLLTDFEHPAKLDPFDFAGNFQLVICKHGRLWIFGDPVGMVKTYQLSDSAIYSTSWLACASLAKTHTVDRVAALQYLALSANYDHGTLFKEVRLAEPTHAHTSPDQKSVDIYPTKIWTNGPKFSTFEDAAQAAAEVLARRFDQVKHYFPGTVVNALSGGFDSRLILAGLKKVDAKALLYVFGSSNDADVMNAKLVSGSLGYEIEHTNKTEENSALPPLNMRELERSCGFFDGIPADGIFDRGVDLRTRARYGSIGSILLNGGAGEIMRDYMILRDGKFTASQLVSVFYSQYLASMFVKRSDEQAFRERLRSSIDLQLGGNHDRYERRMIELAYPLFRARYWLSRNNSVANRAGYFWTIPLDPVLLKQTHHYPMSWKNYGRLEARVIDILDHKTASFQSGYGFAFSDGPPLKFRLSLKLQQHRPPILRRYSAPIKRALGMTKAFPLPAEGVAMLPGDFAISSVFNISLTGDFEQAKRVLTAEYLIRKFNAKIPE
jgi:hypothetical protein